MRRSGYAAILAVVVALQAVMIGVFPRGGTKEDLDSDQDLSVTAAPVQTVPPEDTTPSPTPSVIPSFTPRPDTPQPTRPSATTPVRTPTPTAPPPTTPPPTPTPEPPEDTNGNSNYGQALGSGSFSSASGTSMDLVVSWSATGTGDAAALAVNVSVRCYSIHCGALWDSLTITVGGQSYSFSTPALSYDGGSPTTLSLASATVNVPASSAQSISVAWNFKGSYGETDLEYLTAYGTASIA